MKKLEITVNHLFPELPTLATGFGASQTHMIEGAKAEIARLHSYNISLAKELAELRQWKDQADAQAKQPGTSPRNRKRAGRSGSKRPGGKSGAQSPENEAETASR